MKRSWKEKKEKANFHFSLDCFYNFWLFFRLNFKR
jgi:hypothetical protein